MGLSAVGTAGEPRILALGHDAQQDLLGLLQIRQKEALKLAAAIRVWGHCPQPFERQRHIAFEDLLTERVWSLEITVRQLLNLPALSFCPQGVTNSSTAGRRLEPKRAQRVEIRVDREGAIEERFADHRTQLRQNAQAQAHPGFAAGKLLS